VTFGEVWPQSLEVSEAGVNAESLGECEGCVHLTQPCLTTTLPGPTGTGTP
jgi:hypothetical protein